MEREHSPLPLQNMKRRFAIFNLILMALVLLTTATQSFHAFSHGHDHEGHKKETKHTVLSADDHEDCSICDFHFDFFTAPQTFCLRLDFPFNPIPYSFSVSEGSDAFAGSLFALRAPPVFV